MENCRFDIEKYKSSAKDTEFYTGFCNYGTLLACFDLIKESAKNMSYGNHERIYFDQQVGWQRNLSLFEEYILVLMGLRLGLFERDLAHRFLVSESSVSIIVRTWLRFLRAEFEPLIQLPSRDLIRYYSPKSFKELCPDVVIIVDCTEVETEKPSALNLNSACYSSYKSRTTMKVTPWYNTKWCPCFRQ